MNFGRSRHPFRSLPTPASSAYQALKAAWIILLLIPGVQIRAELENPAVVVEEPALSEVIPAEEEEMEPVAPIDLPEPETPPSPPVSRETIKAADNLQMFSVPNGGKRGGFPFLRRSSGVAWNQPTKGEGERTRLKIGPAHFRVNVGLNTEFNDNITASADDRKSDIIIRPEIGLMGHWRLTDYNSLTLNLTFAYEKHLFQSDLDSSSDTFLLLPVFDEPALQFNFKVKNFYISIYDLPALEQGGGDDELTLSGSSLFRRFVNVAGARVLWDLNDLKVSSSYTRIDEFSLDSEFRYMDRSINQFSGDVTARFSDALSVGWQATLALIDYRQEVLNDGTNFTTGPILNWKPTPFISVNASAGFQSMAFASAGSVQDQSDLNSYYADLTVQHKLNRLVRHQLSIGHQTELGTNSNFVEVSYLRHQIDWSLFNWVSLATHAFVEQGEESGGKFATSIQRVGFGVSLGYNITPRTGVSAYYTFVMREANGARPDEDASLGADDYYQNRIGLMLRYTF